MRELRRRIGTPVVLLSLVLVVMLAAGEPDRDIAVRLWLVGLGAVGVWALVSPLWRHPGAGRRDRFTRLTAAREAAPPAARPSLVKAGRLLTFATGSAGDLHFRARPDLRDIARARLADHGVDIDDPAQAEEAARRCGPLLWSVVRPDRPSPDDRHTPGLPAADLPHLIAHLEAL